MYQIQNLATNPRQKQALVLPDSTIIQISIYFVPMQLGWFIPRLSYKDFTLTGVRITNSPNMLHQYRNQIPFGLACLSAHQVEPMQQEVFASGASKLYILTKEECDFYAEYLANGR